MLLSQPTVAKLSNILHLSTLLLVGPAQHTGGVSQAMEADVFQAVLGAAYVSRRPPSRVAAVLPNYLQSMLSEEVVGLARGLKSLDPKSTLQEFLASFRMSANYESTISGPAHGATFSSRCTIAGDVSGEKVTVKEGTGVSKKAAESHLAKRIITVLKSINTGTDTLDFVFMSSRKLSQLLLNHELAFAPTTAPRITFWWNEGLFCSSALKLGRLDLFSTWLRKIAPLIEASDGPLTDRRNIAEYLRQARQLKTLPLKDRFHLALADVEEMVWRLSPEQDAGDTLTSKGFRTLLQLSMVSRLLSAPRSARKLKDSTQDLEIVLSHGRDRPIAILGNIPDTSFVQREGLLVTVLSAALDSVEQCRGAEQSPIGLETSLDMSTKILSMRLGPIDATKAAGLLNLWRADFLWAFFMEADLCTGFDALKGI